jgi:hypothetical protein
LKFGAGWRGEALAIIEDRRRIEEGNLVRFLIAKQPAQMVQSPKGCCVLVWEISGPVRFSCGRGSPSQGWS